MEELIVDAPAIVDQKCIEVFAQKLDRLLITSAWKNAVDGHIVAHRRPEPPHRRPPHSPARFIHGDADGGTDPSDQTLIRGFTLRRHPRQCLTQAAGCQAQAECLLEHGRSLPQRNAPIAYSTSLPATTLPGPICDAAAPTASEVCFGSRPCTRLPHL